MAQQHYRNHSGGKSHHQRRSLGKIIRFRDDANNIDPELFDTTAKAIAQVVSQGKREHNKSTQLRRFYDELVMWEEKVRQDREKFNEYLPFIRMLKAKAAYAEGRKLVDGAFVDLFDQTIDFVKSADDLRVAKLFLEAFMGYYKLEKGD